MPDNQVPLAINVLMGKHQQYDERQGPPPEVQRNGGYEGMHAAPQNNITGPE